MEFSKNTEHLYQACSNCIRVLAVDAVERAQSGHLGMVLGFADVMTSLVFDFLKYNPNDPKWFNRDRIVLSAGHGCLLLYTFYYLANYINFTLEDIKKFRKFLSKTPGHPEYGSYDAIEVTTGPLGQGFSNSVGMAIAQKKYQQNLGYKICNYKVYSIVGDGCLMEGISYEAASLAGHLELNNLIVLFDNNHKSIDGNTNLCISENQLEKFKSLGWNVHSIDGHNFQEIYSVLQKVQSSNKPSFISCSTLIAKGCSNKYLDSEKAHSGAFGREEIKFIKENLHFKNKSFFVNKQLKLLWEKAWLRNKKIYNDWQKAVSVLEPRYLKYIFPENQILTLKIDNKVKKPEATRVSSGRVIADLCQNIEKIISGSADLSISNNIKNEYSRTINAKDFSGNFIHYGARESAMGGIMNGLAVSGLLAIGSTFLVFSDYMRPSIRLAAVMGIRVIYVMTHDSIWLGEDGATHQPIEHLASVRAIPELLVLRPADYIETIECWELAINHTKGPSMLILTRQPVPQIRKTKDENLSYRGAYLLPLKMNLLTNKEVDVKIFASGSELYIATEVQKLLIKLNISVKVISVPCFELFFKQDRDYIDYIVDNCKLKVAIEAGVNFGWHKIIGGKGLFFGIERFGFSAPPLELYNHFNINSKHIANKIQIELLNLAN